MARTMSPSLRLTPLEYRVTPAITVVSSAQTLSITGSATGLLRISHETATPNAFKVQDGAKVFGTYLVNDLRIQLTSRPGDIQIDLNSKSSKGVIPGNVTVDLGNGYTDTNPLTIESIDIYDSAVVPAGRIGGWVRVNGGNGRETVQIGQFGDAPATNAPITIQGSLTTTLRGGSAFAGDVLTIADKTIVQGNIITYGTDGVNVGEQVLGGTGVKVGGSVIVNSTGSTGTGTFVNVYGTVNGNVSFAGTNAFDTFLLAPTDTGVGGSVNGNVVATLGESDFGNSFQFDVGSLVAGNVTALSGSNSNSLGFDFFLFSGDVFGSVNVIAGNGENVVSFNPSASVFGALSVTGGNGTNDLSNFAGFVGGDLNINLGNGVNTAVLAGTYLGNNISLRGGNYSNDFTYDAITGNPYLRVYFGSGTNTFTWGTLNNLPPGPAFVSGVSIIAAGGAINTYNDNGYTFNGPLYFSNWP